MIIGNGEYNIQVQQVNESFLNNKIQRFSQQKRMNSP